MHPTTRISPLRLIAGLLIALAVFAPGAISAGAQENGLASITIYASLCPEGYQGDDYYEDCYDTPAGAGIEYTLVNLNDQSRTYSGVSGADGFGAVEGIDQDGFYQLRFDVPFPTSSAPGVCSEDGQPFEVGSEYQMNLTTDNDIRCDIFIAPAADNGGENDLASITIYKTFCPVGYAGTSYYADCYDNPGGNIEFGLTNLDNDTTVSGTTGGNGFVAFEGIDTDGSYALSEAIPGDFNDIYVDCSEDGNDFPITIDSSFIYFDLTTDNDIRCDWYNIPVDNGGGEGGTITIHKTACPVGYQGTDYFNDCYGNPVKDVTFTASPQRENPSEGGPAVSGKTGADGRVTLSLPQGTYGVEEDIPGEFIDRFFVYCSVGGERYEIGMNDFRILVDVPAGADIRCDWYNVPTNAQGDPGTLTIYKTACPAGYTGTDYYKDCYNNPRAGIVFGASATKLNFETSGTTDANGFVTLPLPADNSIASPITLAEFPALEVPKGSGKVPFFVYCTVDGVRLDVDYLLVQRDPSYTDIYVASISPEAGDNVRCDWYNLPPKKQTPTPSPAPTKPVTQLPNTGAGFSTEPAFGGLTLGITLLVVGGAAAVGIVTRRVRRHGA